MATADTIDWIGRGRALLEQGALVDALLGFRRGARLAPGEWMAHHGLAEVAGRLRLRDEERTALSAALAAAPMEFEALSTLAESCLAAGAFDLAATAAGRAGRCAPSHPLPMAVHAVARIVGGTEDSRVAAQAREALQTVLRHDPSLLARRGLAMSLGRVVGTAPDVAEWRPVLDDIAKDAGLVASAPWDVLALAAEANARDLPDNTLDVVLAEAARRECLPSELDALRRVAQVASSRASSLASPLRERYANLCLRHYGGGMPLLWPRRTAGRRLRVVALLPNSPDSAGRAALDMLVDLDAEDFDLTLLRIASDTISANGLGNGATDPRHDNPEVVATIGVRERGEAMGKSMAVHDLLPQPEQAARRVALLDPDFIVDLAGIAAPFGPILAQHPGRRCLTLASLDAPLASPLSDFVANSIAELRAVLTAESGATARTSRDDEMTAADLAAALDSAVRAHQRGDVDTARAGYDRLLVLQPGAAGVLYLRAALARSEGRMAAARTDLAEAITAAPAYVEAIVAAAEIATDDGNPEAAAALCAAAIEGVGSPARVLRAWGLAELGRRDGAAAQVHFEQALTLEPNAAQTHYNHGVALQMQRKSAEAARAYQRALALDASLTAADFNLGVLFQERGALDAAIAAYSTVLAQDPANLAAYRNRGETLLSAGRLDAALANLKQFEAAFPDSLAFATHALEVYQRAGDFAGVDRCLDGLRLERFRASSTTELCDELEQLLYLVLFFDVEPTVVFRLYQAYDEGCRRLHGESFARAAARQPGRLRIGYLSADLCDHVMGKMVWQQVQHHDRGRFALHFYALNEKSDEWTARFRELADRFVVLAGTTEHEAAALIRDDDLDLLVDLSTHTKGARPGILALKPARVLVTHVANAGCVGLSAVDFKLTDRYADLPENQEFQLETLLPMEGCVYPYRPVEPASRHPFERRALGIDADAVLIGAFFVSLKLSRRCLVLWREVLERIPRARLVFSPANPAHRESYVRLAASSGIPAERLTFLPQGRSEAENQARYELIDFVLDPMPYGGVNGTLEALGMRVPVVTLLGRRHAERTTYSMLVNLGVTQTIATSGREYVDIADRLANDPAFLAQVRGAIASGLAHSALVDAKAQTRNLEGAYERALALRQSPATGQDDTSGPGPG